MLPSSLSLEIKHPLLYPEIGRDFRWDSELVAERNENVSLSR